MVAGMIAGVWGWRGSFFGLALPTAIFGVIFYIYLRRRTGEIHAQEARRGMGEDKPPPPGNVRRMAAFLTMTVLGGGATMSITAFLTLYAVDRLGASEEAAASLLSILYFSGLWAGPLGGYLSDRVGRVPIIVVTALINGFLIYLIPFAGWGLGFFALLFFIGTNNALRMPVSEVFIMEQASSRHRSTLFGVYYFTMHYTGAVFAPIMGGIIDRWGFDACFTIASCAVLVVTAVCSLFMKGGQRLMPS
jgi:predicted MFS family arabinose efflux permease